MNVHVTPETGDAVRAERAGRRLRDAYVASARAFEAAARMRVSLMLPPLSAIPDEVLAALREASRHYASTLRDVGRQPEQMLVELTQALEPRGDPEVVKRLRELVVRSAIDSYYG